MIATIVCGLVFIVCIVILILQLNDVIYYVNDDVILLLSVVSLLILSTSLICGYIPNGSKEKCELEKNTIIFLLEQKPDENSIKLAEDYNRVEHIGNNYWCRFTLREEDLIDIKSYLYWQ